MPTRINENKPATTNRRIKETFEASSRIHGATKNDKRPAFDGLFETLQKKCKINDLGDYILQNDALTKYVVNQAQRRQSSQFYNSSINTLRSIATYYSAGVMGKRKYQATRLALSMKASNKKRGVKSAINFLPGFPIPKLLTYQHLVTETNKIDVGSILPVNNLCVSDDEHVAGCYRDHRSFLPRLASFYLKTQNSRKDSLKWFGETEGTFIVALGGDGCPFGKNDTACSFLVSFLNTGKRVASSSDNFLIFGANCEEASNTVHNCVHELCKQIDDLKCKIFNISGLHVSFKVKELPNDMKMLATLGGELPNSATYFSSFANVSRYDCTDLKGKYGLESNCKWKPWLYNDRLKTVKAVESFKKPLKSQHIKERTKRNKITDFIAKQKSRQEFPPPLLEN